MSGNLIHKDGKPYYVMYYGGTIVLRESSVDRDPHLGVVTTIRESTKRHRRHSAQPWIGMSFKFYCPSQERPYSSRSMLVRINTANTIGQYCPWCNSYVIHEFDEDFTRHCANRVYVRPESIKSQFII